MVDAGWAVGGFVVGCVLATWLDERRRRKALDSEVGALHDKLFFERLEVEWRQREIEQDARDFWRDHAKLVGRAATIRRLLEEVRRLEMEAQKRFWITLH